MRIKATFFFSGDPQELRDLVFGKSEGDAPKRLIHIHGGMSGMTACMQPVVDVLAKGDHMGSVEVVTCSECLKATKPI